MASFTDSISQFNPYVPELPVEAMKQVGMYKQQQYDAGVQKIQAQIDNIAGLDIMKAIDKPYLQSKLNELGSKLRSVAAGDFSNQQLVNSVGGMAGSIIKDPRIQNSVYSTQKARAELATANGLYKQGKTSINNVNDIQDKVNAYAGSQDPDETFTGKYVNFSDYKKKFVELADNLKKNAPENSKDNPYMTNELGQTIYYSINDKGETVTSTDPKKGGVPKLDAAMKRVTIKGVSAQTIYDAMKTNLSDDDIAQMQIDAKAHYKGKSGEDILQEYMEGADMARRVLKDGITKLSVELLDPKYTAAEKTQMQALMNQYSDKLTNGSFEKEFNKIQEYIKDPKNVDKAHFDAYARNILNKEAVILSNQSYKEELLANPYEAADMARKTLQETIRRDNQNHQEALAQIQLGRDRLNQDDVHFKITQAFKEKEFKKNFPDMVVEESPISTKIEPPTLGNVEQNITDIQTNLSKLSSEYGPILGKDKAGLDEIFSKWKKNPASVTGNDALKYVGRRDELEKNAARQNNIKTLVTNQSKVYDEQLAKELKEIPGIKDAKGNTTVSAKDLYDIANLVVNDYKGKAMVAQKNISYASAMASGLASGYGGAIPVVVPEVDMNQEEILKKVGSDPTKRAIAIAYIKKYNGESRSDYEKSLIENGDRVVSKMTKRGNEIATQKANFEAKTIANLDPYYQQQLGTINKDNKYDMDMLEQLIGNTISKIEQGQGLDMPSGYDAPTKDALSAMLAKGADGKLLVSPVIRKNRDGSALVELHQGSKIAIIPVSAGNLPKYFEKVAQTNPLNEDFYAVAASPNRTTNTGTGTGKEPSDQVTASHTGHELPLLRGTKWANRVKYDIIGDPDNSIEGRVEEKKYAVRLFVDDGKGNWIVDETQGGYRNPATIQDYLDRQLGTQTIETFLKKHK
jgi:hypothetical protein